MGGYPQYMGGDPQYMWGQARSGQPAGRIWPAPHILGVTPYILGVFLFIIIIYYYGGYFLQNMSQNSRDVLFLKKKGPCQATAGCRRNGFLQKSVHIQDFPHQHGKVPHPK